MDPSPGKGGVKKSDSPSEEQVHTLIRMIRYFNQASDQFRKAYESLEKRVAELKIELERKNVELSRSLEEVKNLKNYLTNILESMSSGVICVDLEGRITVFNRAAEAITGYQQAELIGRRYREVFPEQGGTPPDLALRRGRELKNQEKVLTTKDGRKVPIRASVSLLRDERGRLLGAVEVFEDLTELKKLEQEVRQAQTLAALGEMAANAAHQIRNPLGAIGGFAALLERDLDPQDSRRRFVKKIIEGVATLDKIVAGMLFLTRPIQPNCKLVELRNLVQEVVALFKVQAALENPKAVIRTVLPQGQVHVRVDPQLFQEMLLHLLRNALQALEAGGRIRVRVALDGGSRVRIQISDTGKGIHPEIQKRLFHPFATDKSRATGLGLAIVKKIVELHQGEITFKTRENRGTTVTVSIPLDPLSLPGRDL